MSQDIFYRFPEFIREFIYAHNWESLRSIQVAAAETVFHTDQNLLLTSSTASGKTEAAFFPVLSLLCEDPPTSVGVLYIAPLKSLINDQFYRLDELLDAAGISVTHWHGDVAQSHKKKLLDHPAGILQITPESLESMLINRSNDIPRLFGDLRFVIIDEIHTLTGSDRGNQILCQLARIGRLIGYHPRRIGLSATVGDPQKAALWLGKGSGRDTFVPPVEEGRIRWKLGLEHFYIGDSHIDQSTEPKDRPKLEAEQGDSHIDQSTEPKDRPKLETEQGDSHIDQSTEPKDRPKLETEQGDSHIDQSTEPKNKNQPKEEKAPKPASLAYDAGYSFMYDCVCDRKSLVFSNSREETEYLCATLRQIAKNRGEKDVFLIHHGNLSASIREEAELAMKDEDIHAVTCATVTMELGIDIGRLERVLQNQSPNSVTSFLQRLGRSGRRGQPPEMMMVFREEDPLPNTPLPQLIPWELLKAIAIVQLYIEERFIEPPVVRQLPFSLLFHQTLSVLAASGELTLSRLAERVLSLPPFENVPKEDYKALILSMLNQDFLEMTEEKTVIVGLAGERLLRSFKFYAVFKDSEDYTVRCGSDEIGTITTPPPVGDRFALAGRVWEVEDLDIQHKLIYVKSVEGKMEVSWPGDFGEVHTRILERMKQVLVEDTVYPYLKPNAQRRLATARRVARNTGMLEHSLVHLGGYSWCLFPWLGTRSFRAMRRMIKAVSPRHRISGIEYEGCYFIAFKMMDGNDYELIRDLTHMAERGELEAETLVSATEAPVFEKYDDYVPAPLLQHAYAVDKLNAREAAARLRSVSEEF